MPTVKLKEVLNKKGVSFQELASKVEIPIETLRNIYYERVRDPKVSTLLEISKALNCSVNYLLGDRLVNDDEFELLMNYRKCGNHGKALLSMMSKFEAAKTKQEIGASGKHKIPCLVPLEKTFDGFTYTVSEITHITCSQPDAYMAVQMTSNAFAPVFCKGDKILLADRFPESGEKAVFIKNGKVYFREYVEYDDRFALKKINTHTVDMEFHRADQVECIGTYVNVIRT